MKRWILIVFAAFLIGALLVIVGLAQIKIDALQEPGQLETVLASRAKHILVGWRSRGGIPPAPTNLQASIEEGDKFFGADCAACHGTDGRTPTDAGRWMYPRAADLTSSDVQGYSNAELFWIIKNGIRLSGMPAFGRVEPDEHIWNLVHYVRALPQGASPH
jgi:mono/diheme cytochrome c family protein